MSEQVAATAQLHECYNYLAPAVVLRHTTRTLPKQALPPLGNNNQRWITPERTRPTEAAANQPSQAQGNYNITAGPALPSGSHFSQVTTTAAATAKCPPPLLPNDNATTFTMGTKNHGDQKPWGPKPPPGSPPLHIQQGNCQQHGNSQPESHGNRHPVKHGNRELESHGNHRHFQNHFNQYLAENHGNCLQTITGISRAQLEARVEMLNCI
jgi:hypothetical protein